MCEIYDKNIDILSENINPTWNLYQGDFLTADLKYIFGVEKFDIVVGNPPYTVGVLDKKIHKKYYKLSGTGTKKSPHIYFTLCGLDVLKDAGYLLFINPYNYFTNPSTQEYRKILNEYNYHITLFGDNIFKDVKVSSAIHLITKNNIGKYLIKGDEKVEPLIIDWKILKTTNPVVQDIILKMTDKELGDNFDFQFGEFRPDKADENGLFTIIHGSKMFDSNKAPRDNKSIRVYINEIRNINSYPPIASVNIIDNPMFGFSINNLYMVCETVEYAEFVKKYMETDLFQFIFSQVKDNNHNSKHLLNMFIIPKNLKKDFSDDDLYKYFNLNEEEVNLMKNNKYGK